MYTVIRNNQQFGPYSIDALTTYVEDGKILRTDKAFPASKSQNIQTVGYFLKISGRKVKIKHKGSVFQQLKDIGRELIIPKQVFSRKEIMKDSRLLWLALLGLAPAFLIGFFSTIPIIT
ncbi:MAG: PrsW family intramembrane metalloprotease, partial [Bacteroidales bacterium]|nr:PrsW family intramembrane metalloprotease [Bacteroidales bacterium]